MTGARVGFRVGSSLTGEFWHDSKHSTRKKDREQNNNQTDRKDWLSLRNQTRQKERLLQARDARNTLVKKQGRKYKAEKSITETVDR